MYISCSVHRYGTLYRAAGYSTKFLAKSATISNPYKLPYWNNQWMLQNVSKFLKNYLLVSCYR